MPILIGSISTSKERSFGALLAPYLASPKTLFIISSDFCHWGTRFSYTFFQPPHATHSAALPAGYKLSRATQPADLPHPIHKSIALLDRTGMDAIQFSAKARKTPSQAHEEFAQYLVETKNTICGRHPIGVLLGALAKLEGEKGWASTRLEWVRYERSSLVETVGDSSVSYASAFVTTL